MTHGGKRPGAGRPAKSIKEHKLAGTFRRDRHRHLLPAGPSPEDRAAAIIQEYSDSLLFALRWGDFLPPEVDLDDLPLLVALHQAIGGEDTLGPDPEIMGYTPTSPPRPSWLSRRIQELQGGDA